MIEIKTKTEKNLSKKKAKAENNLRDIVQGYLVVDFMFLPSSSFPFLHLDFIKMFMEIQQRQQQQQT